MDIHGYWEECMESFAWKLSIFIFITYYEKSKRKRTCSKRTQVCRFLRPRPSSLVTDYIVITSFALRCCAVNILTALNVCTIEKQRSVFRFFLGGGGFETNNLWWLNMYSSLWTKEQKSDHEMETPQIFSENYIQASVRIRKAIPILFWKWPILEHYL